MELERERRGSRVFWGDTEALSHRLRQRKSATVAVPRRHRPARHFSPEAGGRALDGLDCRRHEGFDVGAHRLDAAAGVDLRPRATHRAHARIKRRFLSLSSVGEREPGGFGSKRSRCGEPATLAFSCFESCLSIYNKKDISSPESLSGGCCCVRLSSHAVAFEIHAQ